MTKLREVLGRYKKEIQSLMMNAPYLLSEEDGSTDQAQAEIERMMLGRAVLEGLIRRIYITKIYTDKPHGLSDKDIEMLAHAIAEAQEEKMR
jgi:hypothetical protein